MTVYFVTRHPGACDWASGEGLAIDHIVSHLDPQIVVDGDIVIGTLPVHLAANICAHGARYLHLSLQMPPALRGKELSAADMRECQACIEEYHVVQVEHGSNSDPNAELTSPEDSAPQTSQPCVIDTRSTARNLPV
ncbi:CRISPR-associated protein Csx16 [Lamprobacter modestohalophilus]|uniref:CRISPR-associated protein Csx16 n=1 Tax=Lamprobacter modestohalophilus TaxID=1064514 RepID=A0A9X0W7Q5_9GAMM|nr:CRISPR-associated protein Csx16 [Lamprobacter modestohalophilus]